MTTTQQQNANRTAAMELTLHRLTNTQPGAAYEELVRLSAGRGIEPLMNIAIHLADAMAAVLVKDCGSSDAAIASLQRQLAEAATDWSAK
jgi:hypothetical protein